MRVNCYPLHKKAQPDETKTTEGGLVDSLIQAVTEEEKTDPALPDNVVAVLKRIYEGGLSEQAASKRKENAMEFSESKKSKPRNLGYCTAKYSQHRCKVSKIARNK